MQVEFQRVALCVGIIRLTQPLHAAIVDMVGDD